MSGRLPPCHTFPPSVYTLAVPHVSLQFLRKALGDAAVPQPLIDIGPAFVAAANAAAGTTLDKKFSPYRSAVEFLHGALPFLRSFAAGLLGCFHHWAAACLGCCLRTCGACLESSTGKEQGSLSRASVPRFQTMLSNHPSCRFGLRPQVPSSSRTLV